MMVPAPKKKKIKRIFIIGGLFLLCLISIGVGYRYGHWDGWNQGWDEGWDEAYSYTSNLDYYSCLMYHSPLYFDYSKGYYNSFLDDYGDLISDPEETYNHLADIRLATTICDAIFIDSPNFEEAKDLALSEPLLSFSNDEE